MYNRGGLITKERLAYLEEIREAERNARFEALVPSIGREAADALKELYRIFTADMLIWYAGLWETEIGGFYFSNSARDTRGLLPDIESTAQALSFLTSHCQMEGDAVILKMPEHIRNKIVDFACSLQDEDGYFYHPQWGKRICTSRRGRDLGWARSIIAPTGRAFPYPLPMERKNGEAEASLPEYLRSVEAFRAYLDTLDITNRSYGVGNTINSQAPQIAGAGPEYAAETVAWINRHQREDNGLWQPEINYDSVNGLMKFAISYSTLGAVMPRAELALKSAMQAALSDEPIIFACQFYNPWAAISALLSGMEKTGEQEKAAALRASFRENAAQLIRVTARKIRTTAIGDGSHSYYSRESGNVCASSQNALVALGEQEGDINGNGCSINGPLRGMFDALGVPAVPLFTKEDGKFLIELMEARVPVSKTRELPEKYRNSVNYHVQ